MTSNAQSDVIQAIACIYRAKWGWIVAKLLSELIFRLLNGNNLLYKSCISNFLIWL
ncbi:MAG: hypothetical protein V7L20_04100 [Nostoc sp.]